VIERGTIVYYAVKGETRYRMPDAYKEMYNDNYLAIKKRKLLRPELFGTEAEHYIPLKTVKE
jgi:hypothetical protein